jgi:hypothetical protein
VSALNRLHLLGFTHDLKGVVFSQRRGGKTATYWTPIDGSFLAAIEKLERARAEAAEAKGKKKGKAASRPAPTEAKERTVLPPVGRSQMSSRLSPSEIQQMLREGRTVKSVVDASKAPQAWVERLLEPVMAERIGVIRFAQGATMSRPRLGRSGLPVEEAVVRNLEERRATSDTIEGLDDAWDARASRSGLWRVWVRFNHRGKRRTAEWNFRKNTREIHPRNRLAAQLGWWPPQPGAAPEPEPLEARDANEGGEQEPQPRKSRRRKPKGRAAKRTARRPARTRRPAKTAKRPPNRARASSRKGKKPAARRRARRRS